MTLHDVAREAEVSLATASRALNGSTRRVRDDLRDRVLAAAAALDYTANAPAQTMARGRSNVVGLLVHDISDPYFSSIAAGVMRAAEQHHLLVTMASTNRQEQREIEYLATLRGQRAAAVILAGSRTSDRASRQRLGRELAAFESAGGRVAMISQVRLPVDTVTIENRAGARALATELADLGHRRFAVLAGPRHLLTARDRLVGFREGAISAGGSVDPAEVVYGDFTRDGGYRSMLSLLDRGHDATCVFAVNDVMAVGAMAALRERKVQLPRDMAVAGFDDISTLRDVTPSLTTVQVPLEAIGAVALELTLQPVRAERRVERVKGEVVLRESTPPLRRV